ncbi:hypothetical protein V1286_003530 [Bradyrhizobium algeriense]|uniref:Uncharacterized protein n=1 Tax=Bradyrhizobium algeriense TaxID=634784 RepID=A0ABU8BBS7_9BRAD
MLRWMTPFLIAIFAIGTAAADEIPAPKSADSPAPRSAEGTPAPKRAAPKNATVRAASKLPPGLPRAHYNYRTTVAPAAAPLYVRRGRTLVVEEEDPDVLFTPVGVVPYAPRVYGTPLLPGSSTLPGYYGTNHSYSYDGPYYGGPSYGPYWNRLPYACGVYGYC